MKILVTGYKGYLVSEFVKKYGTDYQTVGYDYKDGDVLTYVSTSTIAKSVRVKLSEYTKL